MNSLIVGILITLIALLLALIIILIYLLVNAKDEQINRLESELDNLKERKRQTGPTMAAAEDAMAAIANVMVNRDIEQVRLNAALNYLQALRQGPYAYNPETPSGDRKDFK